MSVFEDFDEIMEYAQFWNWAPDWNVAKEVYRKVPGSYSVLTPFAYTYLEEMIRTTTSDYGRPPFNREGQPNKVRVGMSLIALAIEENKDNTEYIKGLESMILHSLSSSASKASGVGSSGSGSGVVAATPSVNPPAGQVGNPRAIDTGNDVVVN